MDDDLLRQAIRTRCQSIRKQLSPNEQIAASSRVCQQIRLLSDYQKAKRIAIYHAIQGEIDLSALQEKACYLPMINVDKTLLFLPVTSNTVFYKNCFGIAEPDVNHDLAILPDDLDIIFLPLVAFDEHGTRLGMGGGYYDRTLASSHRTVLIGVGYDFQRQPFIDRKPWDIPMAAVITESNVYWSKP